MAKDSFGSAPNSTGGFRGVSRQIAAALYGKRVLGGKGDGLSFDERSSLEGQKHTQGIQSDVVRSVLAGQAADRAHRQTMSQAKQKNKLGMADRADAVSAATSNVPEGHIMTGVSFPGGSAKYSAIPKKETGPQFNGVGDTSGQPPTKIY
jgi:hypothetical protein